jgi:hypothetical protein
MDGLDCTSACDVCMVRRRAEHDCAFAQRETADYRVMPLDEVEDGGVGPFPGAILGKYVSCRKLSAPE